MNLCKMYSFAFSFSFECVIILIFECARGMLECGPQRHPCKPGKPFQAPHKTIMWVLFTYIPSIASNLLNVILEMSKIRTLSTIWKLAWVYHEIKAYYQHQKVSKFEYNGHRKIFWTPVLYVTTCISMHHALVAFFLSLTSNYFGSE